MLKLSLECIVQSREVSYSTCEEDTNTALQKVFGMTKSPDNERVYNHIDISRLHLQNRGCIYQVGPRPRPPPPKASSPLLPPIPRSRSAGPVTLASARGLLALVSPIPRRWPAGPVILASARGRGAIGADPIVVTVLELTADGAGGSGGAGTFAGGLPPLEVHDAGLPG